MAGCVRRYDETRDHCLELIAPVVAPGEAGEIASGMVGAELAISPGDRALDVAERRVHPFERCHAGRLSARPGADRLVAAGGFFECAPAARPSVTTAAPGASQCLAPRAISRLRKPLTGASFSCAGAPRDWSRPPPRRAFARRAAARLPPQRHPAEIGVVHLDPPRKRRLPLAPRHHRHDLVLAQAVGCLTPRRRPSSTDEMPFFAVTIRWMAANQSVSGSLGRVEDRARRGRCLLFAPVALIETRPPARNAPDGRSRGRRSRPASAAGPAPCGTAPWCRRLPNASSLRPRTRDATLNPITVTPLYRTY